MELREFGPKERRTGRDKFPSDPRLEVRVVGGGFHGERGNKWSL
jgi:hypothetical protein